MQYRSIRLWLLNVNGIDSTGSVDSVYKYSSSLDIDQMAYIDLSIYKLFYKTKILIRLEKLCRFIAHV